MMVLVRYHNGAFARIPAGLLDNLIRSGEVSHFRRSGGWVAVDRDPVRKRITPLFRGREQRFGWRTNLD
jgi:hypothetical protein